VASGKSLRHSMSRDESSGSSVVGRALEEVFRTTSVIGGGWDSDLAVEVSISPTFYVQLYRSKQF
jgi:hypothetical protein